MVLDFLKGLFGKKELSPYEREVLERKHRKLTTRIQQKERQLEKVPTSRSKKKMNPQVKQLLNELDRLKKQRKDVEKDLGGKPKHGAASRRSKRRG